MTTGIAVLDGKIYISGFYSDSDDIRSRNGSANKACYWINGVRIDLSDQTGNSVATGIAVSENKIYISGWYNNGSFTRACYWVDGVKFDLPVGYGNSFVSDVIIVEGKVYITGGYGKFNFVGISLNNEIDEFIHCYWIDGEKIDLVGQSNRYEFYRIAIAVLNGKVYITGNLYKQNSPTNAGYWIDGKRIDLSNGNEGYRVDGITVFQNKVYVAGSFSGNYIEGGSRGQRVQACYWVDGAKINLPSDTYSRATDIAISSGKVYVLENNQNGICYWVDGLKMDLPDGFQSTRIVIVDD